jgi:predicted DCC family thiol-disulfide oxidoreductase YuxK
MISNNPVILFDGVCNLCNKSIQVIIKNDHKKLFRFASLQGKFGQEVLRNHQLSADQLHSFILLDGDIIFTKSTGALRIFRELGGGWKLLYGFIIIPRCIRDAVYHFVSRNRYKWYGKREECMVPTPELKERFLD